MLHRRRRTPRPRPPATSTASCSRPCTDCRSSTSVVFMTYGPGQTDTTKLVPSVALSVLRGEVPAMSSGRRRVDWIYVDDVVDAMVTAAARRLPTGTSLDLGTGVLTSVADVARLIARSVSDDADARARHAARPAPRGRAGGRRRAHGCLARMVAAHLAGRRDRPDRRLVPDARRVRGHRRCALTPRRRWPILRRDVDPVTVGHRMYELCETLFPICRSITGDGVRQTLDILGEVLPMERHEVPSGTPVLDWTVPPEWNIRDAYVADRPRRARDRLRAVQPPRGRLQPRRCADGCPCDELRPHLHTLPDRPARGALSHVVLQRQLGLLPDPRRSSRRCPTATYDVVIDATLSDGSLTLRRVRDPGHARPRRSSSPRTSATRRWPTTTCRAWRCWPLLGEHLAPGRPALHLPAAVHPRDDRLDHLARRATRSTCERSATAGPVGRRRPGPGELQAQPARRCRDRPGGEARAGGRRRRPPHHRLPPVRLRRAAVLLTGLQPAGRPLRADAAQRVPRVPHVGRRPRFHRPGGDGGLVRQGGDASSRSSRATAPTATPTPTASPSSADAGSTAPSAASSTSGPSRWRCCGCSTYSDGEHDLLDIACRAELPFEAVRSAADALAEAGLLADDDDG